MANKDLQRAKAATTKATKESANKGTNANINKGANISKNTSTNEAINTKESAKTTRQKENLLKAKKGKNDEFYTQLSDIQNELCEYERHFENKVVYCNCDDPKVSNFFLYFAYKFWDLGLKKVICSCYKNTNSADYSRNKDDKGCYFEYDGKDSKGGGLLKKKDEIDNFIKNELKSKNFKGDGDFRSKESIALLKQADIVVTNPPFSLFREYVAQLIEFNKKFVIIGHQNAISYKEIFKLIKANQIWLGYGFRGGAGHFINIHYVDYATASNHKEGMIRVSGVTWFTNLDIKKLHEPFETNFRYSKTPEKYPKYDNYDAINVDKSNEYPMDYKDAMGVPLTFLYKYNPEQFEILGQMVTTKIDEFNFGYPYINGKKIYARIIIKNKLIKKD